MTESKFSLNFLNKPLVSAAMYIKKTGNLLYEKDQLNVSNLIARLWRKYAHKHEITFEYLEQRFREYCRDVLGETPKEINTGVGNLKSPLYRNRMTFNMLDELMKVNKNPIQNIIIEVIDENGVTQRYSALDDVDVP